MRSQPICVAFVLAFTPGIYITPALADVLRVPEDFGSVRAAIVAAVAGDSVLIATGTYSEPGGVAYILPGVSVIGSGWNDRWFESTTLIGIELFFLEGTGPALLKDVWIFDRHVSSENSAAVIRHCRFGNHLGEWTDAYGVVVWFNSGGTLTDSFIQGRVLNEPHEYIKAYGGEVRVTNNVVASGVGTLLWVQNIGGHAPLTLVDVRQNTFWSASGLGIMIVNQPAIAGPVVITNNILQGASAGLYCVGGAMPIARYNDLFVYQPSQCPTDPTNLLENPLLCNPGYFSRYDEFSLNAESPCIGAGEGGADIGALGIGCGITSIGDGRVAQGPRLLVVPNPAREAVRFVFDSIGLHNLSIYNSHGRLIETIDALEGGLQWRIKASMPPGIYYVRSAESVYREVAKFIVIP